MILIHTPVIKPRIQYIFKHFFCSRLGEEIDFTSDLGAFVAHKGRKMSYGEAPLGNEFFISSHGLLTEQSINSIEVKVFDWDGLPAFFETHKKSMLPFDFFAASFYLLTRYEEYQPFVPDSLGRFTAEQSLAAQHNFLHLPLIDMWFERFVKIWCAFFDSATPPSGTAGLSIFVDVPQLYAYKHKTIFRSLFEGIQDFFNFKISLFFDRIIVLLGFRDDPLEEQYQWIMRFHEDQTPFHFFILYTSFGVHDRSLSVFNKKHQQGIKSISDYVPTAPLASVESSKNTASLGADIERFSALIHRPIKAIRQHELLLRFPQTYRSFSELGIKNDYSMQYPEQPGFRASTAFPFPFYDLGDEQQTPLKIHSICLSETHIRNQRFSRKMRQLFLEYQQRLTELNAPFNVALTNESFNSRNHNATYLGALKKILIHD